MVTSLLDEAPLDEVVERLEEERPRLVGQPVLPGAAHVLHLDELGADESLELLRRAVAVPKHPQLLPLQQQVLRLRLGRLLRNLRTVSFVKLGNFGLGFGTGFCNYNEVLLNLDKTDRLDK